jgi:hypothetical protein
MGRNLIRVCGSVPGKKREPQPACLIPMPAVSMTFWKRTIICTLLWSHSLQSNIRELLELHDDLVRRVVQAILPSLSVHEHEALQQTVNEELCRGSFRDPEGHYYVARQLAFFGEQPMALDMLSRAIHHGFFCYPAMLRDPWLDSLRGAKEFVDMIREAGEMHREAVRAFLALKGDALLGTQAESYGIN